MTSQAVLRKFVHKRLSPAIPVNLKRSDEYAVGKVLLHSKKPQKVIPMRGQDLTPTGVSAESLLATGQQLSISYSKKLLFDTSKDERSGQVEVDISEDSDLQEAVAGFGSEAGKKMGLHIAADLGCVEQLTSSVVKSVAHDSIRVQMGHPVVQRAVESGGGALFIIGAIIQVDRCNISVRLSEAGSEYIKVISHDQPMTLAYKVVKVDVDSSGLVHSVLNKQLKSVASVEAKPAEPDGADEEEDVERYLYCMKDFQPFDSENYSGILDEAKIWVAPLLLNTKLQDTLLTYTKPPRTFERLNHLSSYFLEVGNAMRANRPVPKNKQKDIDPIINALSKDHETRLDEITAIIIVAEAADEFPQHIVQMIIDLPLDKRRILLGLIVETPYASSRHVYADEGPYRDPVLRPILSRMGFSIPPNTQRLLHARRDFEDEEDTLTAAIILMLGSAK